LSLAPPDRPLVGVGAVVIHEGRVLLIRRGKEPLRGRWSVPGGTLELGETLKQAVVREVLEETGVEVRPRDVVMVFDRIERAAGAVRYHYVIIDYLCDYVSGMPRAGDDAEAVALVAKDDLPGYDLPDKALEVVLDGFRRAAGERALPEEGPRGTILRTIPARTGEETP
jgi:ADP-ribose pyrophosphatase YjhB (NUDIX family)